MNTISLNSKNQVLFGAKKLDQKIYVAIKSLGDGSFTAVPFTSQEAADTFAQMEHDRRGEHYPDVEEIGEAYDTAEEAFSD